MHVDPNLLYVAGVSVGANIDNFGVAVAYALSRKTLSLGANAFIAFVSALFCLAASGGASILAHLVSRHAAAAISGGILIAIGLWGVADLIREIRILRRDRVPSERAGSPAKRIGFAETVMLAVALALNAGAAGLATGFGHHPQIATAASIAFFSFTAILVGQWSGQRVTMPRSPLITQAIGAAVLVTIGIFQFP